jgi:hypothetical protein
VTRMCPRGTRGDLKGGHGEVKDVALMESKRLLARGGPVSLRPGRLPPGAESINGVTSSTGNFRGQLA